MVWQPEIDQIKYRQQLAKQMGGIERVTRQHEGGKLTIRERIAKLADPESFKEIGSLSGTATYDIDKLVSFTPAGDVMGTCNISNRKVVVVGGDFTVRGGVSAGIGDKTTFATKMALDFRLPLIRLLDAVGGSIKDGPDAHKAGIFYGAEGNVKFVFTKVKIEQDKYLCNYLSGYYRA